MRKVEYPIGTNYVQDYLNVFQNKIGDMRNKWVALQRTYPTELGHIYTDVNDILIADFSDLVKWYIQFEKLPYATRKVLNDKLKKYLITRHGAQTLLSFLKTLWKVFNSHHAIIAIWPI